MNFNHTNHINLIGQISNEPYIVEKKNGISASFCVRTSETYLDDKGKTIRKSDWHQVKAYGRLARMVKELAYKSQPLAVEGKMESSFFTTKRGEKRHISHVVANDLILR